MIKICLTLLLAPVFFNPPLTFSGPFHIMILQWNGFCPVCIDLKGIRTAFEPADPLDYWGDLYEKGDGF